eukprot:4475851-Prymnesium_polylepis.1
MHPASLRLSGACTSPLGRRPPRRPSLSMPRCAPHSGALRRQPRPAPRTVRHALASPDSQSRRLLDPAAHSGMVAGSRKFGGMGDDKRTGFLADSGGGG